MHLSPYIDDLRHELAVAADAGGEDARALAERLTAPLESATRLALLSALSAAADEITRDLAPGSVELRLRGTDPEFVVTPPPADLGLEDAATPVTGARPPAPPPGDEGTTSRINLRLPEHLKVRIEEAAAREGLSVNAWLVRTVAAALQIDDRGHGAGRPRPSAERRYTGWVR